MRKLAIFAGLFFLIFQAGVVSAKEKKSRKSTTQKSETHVIPDQRRFGIMLKAGPSILTQNIAENTNGNVGPMIGWGAIYDLNKNVSFGLDMSWETHATEAAGIVLGNIHTVSIMPFWKVRSSADEKVNPYFYFGMGGNFNGFMEGTILDGLAINPSDSFGIKVAGGLEGFIQKNVSLGVELGWKLNKGAFSYNVDAPDTRFNASCFQILFTLTPYFY